MKMAVQFWLNQGVSGRTKFLSFRGGYHGDTFAAMSVCDPDEGMHALFSGVLAKQIIVDLPTDEPREAAFEAALDAHAQTLAAIIVEPLAQGAGGMIFHSPEVLRKLRRAADRHGLLLIFDEVFTGFGRTGTLFACEAAGVVPDIMALSKALTGGTMGLAATIATSAVFEAFLSEDPAHALMHGPTFMANPLACAAANASLDLFEREPRLRQVAAIAAALAPRPRTLPGTAGRAGRPRSGRDRRRRTGLYRRHDGVEAALRRGGRLGAPVPQHRLSDAGFHHRRG